MDHPDFNTSVTPQCLSAETLWTCFSMAPSHTQEQITEKGIQVLERVGVPDTNLQTYVPDMNQSPGVLQTRMPAAVYKLCRSLSACETKFLSSGGSHLTPMPVIRPDLVRRTIPSLATDMQCLMNGSHSVLWKGLQFPWRTVVWFQCNKATTLYLEIIESRFIKD